MSLPSRGAWIEMWLVVWVYESNRSLPSRGAWIEIYNSLKYEEGLVVAPFTGSVD